MASCAIALYGLLQMTSGSFFFFDPARAALLLSLTLVGLGVSFYHLPWGYAIGLIFCFIPLEFSVAIGHFPVLSPVDYLCATAAIAMLFRYRQTIWEKAIVETFGRTSTLLWLCFLAWGTWDALSTGGNVRGILRWGEFLFIYALAARAVQDNSETATLWILRTLRWPAVAVSVMALYQFITTSGDYTYTFATFGQENAMAAYLSLCFAFCWGMIGPSILLASALIASYSRGAWMGLLGAAFILFGIHFVHKYFGAQTARRCLVFIIGAIIFFGAVLPLLMAPQFPFFQSRDGPSFQTASSEPQTKVDLRHPKFGPWKPHRETHEKRHILSLSQRPVYWCAALSVLSEHPFKGLGPGNYIQKIPHYTTAEHRELYFEELRIKKRVEFWQHLHNLYLQIAVEYGGVGFLLWGMALFSLYWPLVSQTYFMEGGFQKRIYLFGILAFLIHSGVDFLAVHSLDLIFVTLTAVIRYLP